MKYIELVEYSSNGHELIFESPDDVVEFEKAVELTNSVWKKKLGLSKDPFHARLKDQNTLLMFSKGVTGFINIGEFSFEIKPKFLDNYSDYNWKIALTNLLLLQDDSFRYKSNMITASAIEKDLPDFVAERFLSELESGLLKGLPSSYTYKEEFTTYFRGTYDTHKAIEHLYKPELIPSRFDDYNQDTLINRVFKLASIHLLKSVKDYNLSNRLLELSYRINAETILPDVRVVESIELPTQYMYLEEAFNIAKLILSNNSILFAEGRYNKVGFLWQTHVIFEKFIKMLVEMLCSKNSSLSFTDQSIKLYTLANETEVLSRNIGRTSPDIRIFENNKIKWVLDVKYKKWNNGPKINDVYQMITAAQVSKIQRASLIFPEGMTSPDHQIYYNINNILEPGFISCIFIDINKLADPKGLDEILKIFEDDLNNQLS